MTVHRYIQIANSIAQDIASQRFGSEAKLPTELELCTQFQASRYTIRAALKQLEDDGLLTRKKRSGTFAKPSNSNAGFQGALASVDDLVQLAATHERRVLKSRFEVLSAAKAKELGVGAETRWLQLTTLRIDQQRVTQPVCISEVYLDQAYASLRDHIEREPAVLVSALIEAHFGKRITLIRQAVTAVLVNATQAKLLAVAPNSPALKITRHYCDRFKKPLEITVSVHPASRFKLTMQLARESTADR
jgi:GntR family transcriptional regulator